MENNQIASKEESSMFLYTIFPFHVVSETQSDLFDMLSIESLYESVPEKDINALRQIMDELGDSKSKIGDLSKYYNFTSNHFGQKASHANLEIYKLDTGKLKPNPSFPDFKKFDLQFAKNKYFLGNSDIILKQVDSVYILINPIAELGYVLFGFELSCTTGKNIFLHLSESEFFRNIGWRNGQGETEKKKNHGQFEKHAFSFMPKDAEIRQFDMTVYNMINCYFSPLSKYIRFYYDRLTVFYTSTSFVVGDRSDNELRQIFFETLRVPDKNSKKFSHELSEPNILRVGRNVIFTALNEGAVVLELVNERHEIKALANKYLPAFLLAFNQREILLKTMQRVSHLNAGKLLNLDEGQLRTITQLKANLLVLQLKQIFYSISNTHEVELFFNHLQKVFNIEIMLKENDQSIRELYNLLELKKAEEQKTRRQLQELKEKEKAEEQKRQRELQELKEKEKAEEQKRQRELQELKEKELDEKEENRAKIVNAILGVIACLGLFSFLKDLLPFLRDSQYFLLYKSLAIILPLGAGIWLLWYMFGRKNK